MKIEFYRHSLEKEDKNEVAKVLDSVFLTSGEWTKAFERKLADYVESRYAVGLTSCTNALEITLKYFGIEQGDEVITTPMSFIATANAVEYCGAKPVFVDVEPDTANINADLIESVVTPRTKAILPVHLYGHMCDMGRIRKIADKHGLKVIEDAAHCMEGQRDGIKPGQVGDAACFSFYATKNITCGEGGAVSCNDPEMYDWLFKARMHGMTKNAADRYSKKYEHYDMDFLGFKCNMSNIQAALLIHQIERIETLLSARQRIAQRYDEAFLGNPGIKVLGTLPGTRHARHLYTILVDPRKRDEYMHRLQEAGVGVAINYRSIHLMKYYRQKYGYKRGDFPVCERIGDSTISIPFYPKLSDEEAGYIINAVNSMTNS